MKEDDSEKTMFTKSMETTKKETKQEKRQKNKETQKKETRDEQKGVTSFDKGVQKINKRKGSGIKKSSVKNRRARGDHAKVFFLKQWSVQICSVFLK